MAPCGKLLGDQKGGMKGQRLNGWVGGGRGRAYLALLPWGKVFLWRR